jgi:hypothetical protein
MGQIRWVREPTGMVAVLRRALRACGAADASGSSPPLDSERPPTTWTPLPDEAAADSGLGPLDDAAAYLPSPAPGLAAPEVTPADVPR